MEYESLEFQGYIVDKNDPEIEEALAYLLAEGVLICSFVRPSGWPLAFAILCNDVFCRAADAESLHSEKEIYEIFTLYQKGGIEPVIEWIAERRGIRPLREKSK